MAAIETISRIINDICIIIVENLHLTLSED